MLSPESSYGRSREDKWKELFARYLNVLPGQVETMAGAFESGDMAKVETEAHKVKGTAGTYGLSKIAEAASRVELLAKSWEMEQTCKEIGILAELVQVRRSEL